MNTGEAGARTVPDIVANALANKGTRELNDGGIVAPNVRAFDELEPTLIGWLAGQLPEARNLRAANFAYPQGAGLSHETILFDAIWNEPAGPVSKGLVVRIKPTTETVYLLDQFEPQYAIMEAVERSGAVPVARPLWLETDPAILGAPFFVMEKKHGRVPVNYPPYAAQGWVMDLTPTQRRTMWESGVRALASIQKVPQADVGFLDPEGQYADGFEQEWDRWAAYLDWIRADRDLPFLEDIWARLGAGRPTSRQPGIVWGDARIGNLMFADDMSVAAVMDWEQPGIGGALHDLGWWTTMQHIETADKGLPLPDGFGSRAETIALWSDENGIDTAEIDWYEKFAAFKLACLAVRTLELRNTDKPGMNAIVNPPVRLLAERYGLPLPVVK